LPAGQQQRLFDSMVGQRSGATAGNGPHLGLGLYIVRLVAEFHGGRPVAANLETGNGVAVGMELPLASDGD
jgi:K+-sensing histidine kinase KdpD